MQRALHAPLAASAAQARQHQKRTLRTEWPTDIDYYIHLRLIDMLMGPFKLPRDGSFSREYGILKPETVPKGIVRQHLAPFFDKW